MEKPRIYTDKEILGAIYEMLTTEHSLVLALMELYYEIIPYKEGGVVNSD